MEIDVKSVGLVVKVYRRRCPTLQSEADFQVFVVAVVLFFPLPLPSKCTLGKQKELGEKGTDVVNLSPGEVLRFGLGCVTQVRNNPGLDLFSRRFCSLRAHLGQGYYGSQVLNKTAPPNYDSSKKF